MSRRRPLSASGAMGATPFIDCETSDGTARSERRRSKRDEAIVGPAPHGKARSATEDRETSHFMGNLLESINPELKTLYFGGAPNVHLDRVANHLHDEFYTTDPLGRVTTANRRYTFNRSLPGPGVWGPERVGNPTEFHGR